MEGNSAAVQGKGTGKVLKSNDKSKVFLFFSDHGAPGLIAFPTKYLYADQFNTIINNMYENKMYSQMVLYIEACESGSMFNNILKNNINVYAVTAANPSESSWGTYCYPDDVVNGVHMNTCLGDLFSVNWIENADATKPDAETLE
jgi:legumain